MKLIRTPIDEQLGNALISLWLEVLVIGTTFISTRAAYELWLTYRVAKGQSFKITNVKSWADTLPANGDLPFDCNVAKAIVSILRVLVVVLSAASFLGAAGEDVHAPIFKSKRVAALTSEPFARMDNTNLDDRLMVAIWKCRVFEKGKLRLYKALESEDRTQVSCTTSRKGERKLLLEVEWKHTNRGVKPRVVPTLLQNGTIEHITNKTTADGQVVFSTSDGSDLVVGKFVKYWAFVLIRDYKSHLISRVDEILWDDATNLPRDIALALSYTNHVYAWREEVIQAYSDDPTGRVLVLDARYVWAAVAVSATSVLLALLCMVLRRGLHIKPDLASFRGILSVARDDILGNDHNSGVTDSRLGIVHRADCLQLSVFMQPGEKCERLERGERLAAGNF